MKKRAIALIDGEHYPPVVQNALSVLAKDERYELVGAVFIGGTEKVREDGTFGDFGIPVVGGQNQIEAVVGALHQFRADVVIDLSDEPVIGYEERFKFACRILDFGASYTGPDFHFESPIFEDIVQKPSIAIIGTGKRTGKTAVSAYVCRELKQAGHSPCVVAMGRGGPEQPEILHGEDLDLTPQFLLEESRSGRHAASDYFEDALMSRITTIGCRRCGGGMAGAPYVSNVLEGAALANKVPEKLIIFEGSGAAEPPVLTDAKILIASAAQPHDYIVGYFGPYRILQSDLIVITMCEPPLADEEIGRAHV
jgi:cyclic 2,3-diphosphoglycerate synthase